MTSDGTPALEALIQDATRDDDGPSEPNALLHRIASAIRSLLYVESDEHDLTPVPRADGMQTSPFLTRDIGFYLPSHYFEREDGQNARSMAGTDDEWASDTAGMAEAMEQVNPEELLALFDSNTPRGKRTEAAKAFLADILTDV